MNGNKPIIHFLSASDRLNYGDLLFPIIFKKVIEKNGLEVDFYNYGLVKSDLSHFGALPTLSYSQLIKNIKKYNGNLIIGGGEVFFPNWVLLFSYVNSTYNCFFRFNTFKKLENKYNFFRRFVFRHKNKYPFCHKRLNNEKIIYNAVGGSFNNYVARDDKSQLINNLKSADYISVRENDSAHDLGQFGINVSVSPDSALLMSDFFSKEFLLKRFSKPNLIISKRYIFLQFGLNKQPELESTFFEELNIYCSKNELEIILCPIGLAEKHEDDKVLKEIEKKYNYTYHKPEDIYEIMCLIANAEVYMGTSLHGLITAQSYNRKFIPLNDSVSKLNRYCETWFGSYNILKAFNYDDWGKIEKQLFNWDNKNEEKLKNYKNLIYKNFEKIFIE